MSMLSYSKRHELHTVTLATSATTGLEGPCSAEDWLCDEANQPSSVIVGECPGDVLGIRSTHGFDDIDASSTRSVNVFFLSAVVSSATVFLAFATDSAGFLTAAFFSLVLNNVAELQKWAREEDEEEEEEEKEEKEEKEEEEEEHEEDEEEEDEESEDEEEEEEEEE